MVQSHSTSSTDSHSAGTVSWDRLGIGLSGLCALHCLLLPVALAVLPVWPFTAQVHDWMHPVLGVLLIPVTLFAAWSARRKPQGAWIIALLIVGLLIVLSAFLLREALGVTGEAVVTLIGSCLLIAGHWRNWRGSHRHIPSLEAA